MFYLKFIFTLNGLIEKVLLLIFLFFVSIYGENFGLFLVTKQCIVLDFDFGCFGRFKLKTKRIWAVWIVVQVSPTSKKQHKSHKLSLLVIYEWNLTKLKSFYDILMGNNKFSLLKFLWNQVFFSNFHVFR